MLIDNNVAVIYRAGGRDRETAPRRQEPFVRSFLGACFGALTGTLLVACAPAPETKAAAPEAVTPARQTEMKPAKSGYAEVDVAKIASKASRRNRGR